MHSTHYTVSSIHFLRYYIILLLRVYSHIPAHIPPHTRIPTHTRAYSRTRTHTRAYPRILAYTCAYSSIYSRILAHTRTYPRILAHARAYSLMWFCGWSLPGSWAGCPGLSPFVCLHDFPLFSLCLPSRYPFSGWRLSGS